MLRKVAFATLVLAGSGIADGAVSQPAVLYEAEAPVVAAAPPKPAELISNLSDLQSKVKDIAKEYRVWSEANAKKLKESYEELVSVWKAAAAAAEKRIQHYKQLKQMDKQGLKELWDSFFLWLKKLIRPIGRVGDADLVLSPEEKAAPFSIEAGVEERMISNGLLKEVQALLEALQSRLSNASSNRDQTEEPTPKLPLAQPQQEQQTSEPLPDVEQPQPEKLQPEEEQQHEDQPRPEEEQQHEAQPQPEVQPEEEQPQQPADEQPLEAEVEEPQQAEEQQPQPPEFEQPDEEIQLTPVVDLELLPAHISPSVSSDPSETSSTGFRSVTSETALLSAAVQDSLLRAEGVAQRLAASAAASLAASGGSTAAKPSLRALVTPEEVLRQLEQMGDAFDKEAAAAVKDLAEAEKSPLPQEKLEEIRGQLLRSWLLKANLYQQRLHLLTVKASLSGIPTDVNPKPDAPDSDSNEGENTQDQTPEDTNTDPSEDTNQKLPGEVADAEPSQEDVSDSNDKTLENPDPQE